MTYNESHEDCYYCKALRVARDRHIAKGHPLPDRDVREIDEFIRLLIDNMTSDVIDQRPKENLLK